MALREKHNHAKNITSGLSCFVDVRHQETKPAGSGDLGSQWGMDGLASDLGQIYTKHDIAL